VEVDEGALRKLKEEGIDDLLAAHVAHLFVRDPLVIFDGLCEEVDDQIATDHFENLQSTNWNSVRWKPPPVESDIGWRVELRTMEVQLTDFENAAFTVFCVLVLRVLLSFDLNIYVPMSKVSDSAYIEAASTWGTGSVHAIKASRPRVEGVEFNTGLSLVLRRARLTGLHKHRFTKTWTGLTPEKPLLHKNSGGARTWSSPTRRTSVPLNNGASRVPLIVLKIPSWK